MKFCAMCVLALLSHLAFAQESNDLARRSDFLNRSDYMRREYLLTRNDLQKPGGLNDRFAKVNSDLIAWVGNWVTVRDLINTPPNATLPAMEGLLGDELNKQSDSFANTQVEMLHVMLEYNAVAARLTSLQPIDYRIERYNLGDRGQTTLEAQISELNKMVQAQSAQLSDSALRINTAIKELRSALDSKIATIWAKKGIATLDAILTMLDDLDNATKLLSPLESSFLDNLGRYQVAYSEYRILEAFDYGKIFADQCQNIEASVNGLKIADRYKASAIKRFKSLCEVPVGVVNKIAKNPAGFVDSAVKRRKQRIETICSSDQSYTMNCSLFSSVYGLSSEQIKALPMQNLRQLEEIYNAIEDNRRRGNIFQGIFK